MSTVTAQCHCHAFSHTLTLPKILTVPILGPTCNCNSCRSRTGSLAIFPFPASAATLLPAEEVLGSLKKYESANGETGNTVTSYFCGTCGTKVYFQISKAGGDAGEGPVALWAGWLVGCLDELVVDGKPLIELNGHTHLEDTIDGGLSNIWTSWSDRLLSIPKLPIPPPMVTTPPTDNSNDEPLLHIHCHCHSFSIHVSRPKPVLSEEGKLPRGCYWYRPGMKDTEGNVGDWRYMASWCACSSCRTTSGSSLPAVPYVQIPFADIHTLSPSGTLTPYLPPGTKMTFKTELPSLTRCNTSPETDPNIARYFCTTCGASVLYFDETRSFIGTWSVGLVDADQLTPRSTTESVKVGALAQDWLSWWTGMEGHPNPPVHCVDEGRERWGTEVMDGFVDGWVKWGKKVGQRI